MVRTNIPLADTLGNKPLSAYGRCPLTSQCFRLVHVKFLLTEQKCNYGTGKIFPRKSHLKVPGGLFKTGKTLTTWPFSGLWEVILALWTSKWASTSACREVSACKVLVEKLPGPQFGLRLWEVSAYGKFPLTEVPL